MTFAVEISLPIGLLGLIVGTTYGLLAVGLVLVYRSGRVINFAYGEIGAFAAAVFGVLVLRSGVPYYVAFLAVLVLGAAVGVLTEATVMRRLSNTPEIVKIVATIGVATFLQLFSLVVSKPLLGGFRTGYPLPPWFPSFEVGPVFVTQAHTAMLALTPVVVGGLALVVQRSRIGVGIRAAADNVDAARLAGVSASRMSAISWGLAGAVSAYTAVLLFPTLGIGALGAFGPALLLRGLAAAVIARMSSLSVAFASGVGIGVIEQEIHFNVADSGPVNVMLLLVIVSALFLQRRSTSTRERDGGNWSKVQVWQPLTPEVRGLPAVKALMWSTAVSAILIGVVLGALVTNNAATILTAVVGFAMIGLGVGLISGLAGQLSLGQAGVAAVGAAISFLIVRETGNFVLALPLAGAAGAAVSVILGLPSVRIPGLMFAVVTLAFAQAVPWGLSQEWLFGTGSDPGRPIIGDFALDTSRRYYFFALAMFVAALLFVRNVWRGAIGRRYRAVRDNERAAQSFTLSPVRVKVEAFAIAGFVTGVGGAVYAHLFAAVEARTFPVSDSLAVVAVAAIGGIGFLAGPILGALYIVALPRFLPLDEAGLAATSLGWLLLLLQFPGGIAEPFAPLRAWVLRRVAGASALAHAPDDDVVQVTRSQLVAASPRPATDGSPSTVLRVEQLTKTYGGRLAVDGVSFEVLEGETLGVIGPNGAGKTTVFELISGFVRPDDGRVVFGGRDVTALSADRRAHLGLIRSFQDAALFPTLTVLECVQLALERRHPTRVMRELSGVGSREPAREQTAAELVELMGLNAHRAKEVGELSTGTRRVAEIACLLALEPIVLLLDEPTSGIAQRESEAMGALLTQVKAHLRTTLVVIEHDIPLVMGISDRMIAMGSGAILATGSPASVRAHPAVVASYLGTSGIASRRSGELVVAGRCAATTQGGSQCSRTSGEGELCTQHARLAGARR